MRCAVQQAGSGRSAALAWMLKASPSILFASQCFFTMYLRDRPRGQRVRHSAGPRNRVAVGLWAAARTRHRGRTSRRRQSPRERNRQPP